MDLERKAFLSNREIHKFSQAVTARRNLSASSASPKHLVVSPGGVASSAIIQHLERFIDVNSPTDKDGLKHIFRPSQIPAGVQKILFLFDKTGPILKSLERRNYHQLHIAKLGGVLRLAPLEAIWKPHLTFLVLRQRRTFLSMQKHRMINCGPEVLCISMSQIFESATEVRDFFEIQDEAFIVGFPKRRARKSQDLMLTSEENRHTVAQRPVPN